jgi:hypothetical protein
LVFFIWFFFTTRDRALREQEKKDKLKNREALIQSLQYVAISGLP